VFSFTGLFRAVQKEPVKEFKRQCLVEFGSVVTIPLEMTLHNSLKTFPFNIWPGKSA
jgi:hypothetical protein